MGAVQHLAPLVTTLVHLTPYPLSFLPAGMPISSLIPALASPTGLPLDQVCVCGGGGGTYLCCLPLPPPHLPPALASTSPVPPALASTLPVLPALASPLPVLPALASTSPVLPALASTSPVLPAHASPSPVLAPPHL